MAKADGSILIDTHIDTKGIVVGTDEVIQSARRMSKQVNGLSASVRASFSRQADAIQKAARAYDEQKNKVEGLRQKLEELSNQQIPTEGYKNLEAEIKKNETALDKLIEKKRQLEESGKSSILTDEYKAAAKEVERLENKLNSLYAKEEKFSIQGGSQKAFESLEYEITDIELKLAEAKKKKDELTSKSTEASSQFQQTERDIERISKGLDELRAKKEKMELEGTAFTMDDTSAIESTSTKLEHEEARLNEMNRSLTTSYEALKNKILEYGGSLGGLVGPLQATLKGLKTVGKTLLHLPINAIKGIISGLKTLAKTAMKAALSLAQMVGRGLLNGLKKLTAGIFGLNKTTGKSTGLFKGGLKSLLMYGLGVRSLFALVNKLRSAMSDGMQNLAQYSSNTNDTLSGLMSSLEQCKNALATAFDPILQAVAPALNYLINLVTAAATAVAHLIAALTGKSTFIKATKVQKDYAKSLKSTGSAAKSAGEDAEGALAPFDKLNVMAEESTGKGGGGGGAGGTLAEDMFETVPVESKFKQLADNLKKFIKSQDWKGLGAYIANGLNAGLQKIYDVISWDNVGPKITYFVNAFTETFNSIVDNLDWDLLGRTIGTGINTVVNTLNLLIEGIDWENIGIKLSVGFRGMLNEINWTNLGNLIGNKFMISWNVFKGFVDDMWRTNNFTGLNGWNELGISLAQGFNGVFEKIDFGQIGTTLGKVITGIFQAAIDFAKTFDWKGLGENIANGINQFLENFDATTVVKGTNEVIKGLLDSLIIAIEKTDWNLMGEKLAEFIVNLDWDGMADRLFTAIGVALAGLQDFLWGIIGVAWDSLVDFWKEHIEGKSAGEIISGLFQGIKNALSGIGIWIKEHIFDPFMKGFKTVFGIHSPSTVMQEMGGYLMDGLKNGISNFIPNVIQKFTELKEKIISKWDEVKQNTATKWEEIKSNLSQKWDNLKTTAGTIFSDIRQRISGMWGDVQSDTSSKWGNIKDTLFSVWDNLKDKAEKIFGKIKDAVKNTWEKIQGFDEDVGTAGRSALAAASAAVKTVSPSTQSVKLPRLASGTVVPPRAGEFAAILGDNNRESEVVSPLSTMKQALKEALQESGGIGNGGEIVGYVYLDGKEMGKSVVKFIRQEKDRTGKNPVMV